MNGPRRRPVEQARLGTGLSAATFCTWPRCPEPSRRRWHTSVLFGELPAPPSVCRCISVTTAYVQGTKSLIFRRSTRIQVLPRRQDLVVVAAEISSPIDSCTRKSTLYRQGQGSMLIAEPQVGSTAASRGIVRRSWVGAMPPQIGPVSTPRCSATTPCRPRGRGLVSSE